MDIYRKNFFKKLGISENKYNFIARHINENDDEISKEYIKSKRLKQETVRDINIEKLIYRIGMEEFIKDFKMYLWGMEIPSLKMVDDIVLKERIKRILFYYLETEIRIVISILHKNSMDDILRLEREGNFTHNKTWYDLYHDDLGFLNQDNKIDFLYKIDNGEEVDFFYRFFSKEEVLGLFHKFNRYSPAELNLLHLDHLYVEDIMEMYYHFMEVLMDTDCNTGSGLSLDEVEHILKEDYLSNHKVHCIIGTKKINK
ncbi:MAG: hypothetical protein ACOCRK_01990 [bacterium]